ncbi:MAG: ABC transporter ATP-binding protein [Planctomycetota bacterium]|jgi:ABC-2 type transport system ATP-binding protein
MNNSPLKANSLHKSFGKRPVLQGIDFELRQGEITVLLGANGTGKSTFFKCALGLLLPDRGSIEVLGLDPSEDAKRLRQQIGFVPSVPDAYDWMTVGDLFRLLTPQYPEWNQSEAERLCAELKVPMDRRFKHMSRGEGMKAMLVAALTPDPKLLLLDEPFGGLDPMAREEVLSRIIDEARVGERTLLCSTHDMEVASRIADRVAVLEEGKIERHGPVSEILQKEAVKPADLQAVLAGETR